MYINVRREDKNISVKFWDRFITINTYTHILYLTNIIFELDGIKILGNIYILVNNFVIARATLMKLCIKKLYIKIITINLQMSWKHVPVEQGYYLIFSHDRLCQSKSDWNQLFEKSIIFVVYL